MNKKREKSLISEVAGVKAVNLNKSAIEAYENYKKATNIIARSQLALGKKIDYQSNSSSTLNLRVDPDGISSTTKKNF